MVAAVHDGGAKMHYAGVESPFDYAFWSANRKLSNNLYIPDCLHSGVIVTSYDVSELILTGKCTRNVIKLGYSL